MAERKSTWQLQEAKNKLSEVIRRAREEGPQTITVRGEVAAILTFPERRSQKSESHAEFFKRVAARLSHSDDADDAVHLLATIAKIMRPGGVRAVVAESVLLKHQLVISSRARRRAPNLSSLDRFVLALGSLFVPASRLPQVAVILKPRTLLKFHEALKRRKYRQLFSSDGHRRPGPKGPSQELIDAIVAFKRRNPRIGCPRIAQEIADDEKASHADRLRALDFLAKYGLGTTVTETDTDGNDVAIRVIREPRRLVGHD